MPFSLGRQYFQAFWMCSALVFQGVFGQFTCQNLEVMHSIGKFSNLWQLLNYDQISKVSNHLTFVGLTPVGSQHFQAFWMPKCTGFQGHRRQSTGQNLIRPLEVVVHRIGKFSNLRQLLNIDPISNFSKQLTSIGLAQLGIQHFLAFFSILDAQYTGF